jgi:hypothetical protein
MGIQPLKHEMKPELGRYRPQAAAAPDDAGLASKVALMRQSLGSFGVQDGGTLALRQGDGLRSPDWFA